MDRFNPQKRKSDAFQSHDQPMPKRSTFQAPEEKMEEDVGSSSSQVATDHQGSSMPPDVSTEANNSSEQMLEFKKRLGHFVASPSNSSESMAPVLFSSTPIRRPGMSASLRGTAVPTIPTTRRDPFESRRYSGILDWEEDTSNQPGSSHVCGENCPHRQAQYFEVENTEETNMEDIMMNDEAGAHFARLAPEGDGEEDEKMEE